MKSPVMHQIRRSLSTIANSAKTSISVGAPFCVESDELMRCNRSFLVISVVVLPILVYQVGLLGWCYSRHARIRAAGGSLVKPGEGEVLFGDPRVGSVSVFLGTGSIDDANIRMLDCYHAFFILDLSNTKVTSAGLESLPNLRVSVLRLRNVRLGDTAGHFLEDPANPLMLIDLDLANTGVTDRIGPSLARLQRLGTLDLSGTEVTDGIISHVQQLAFLTLINLSQTKVTRNGVVELQRAKPGLVVGY